MLRKQPGRGRLAVWLVDRWAASCNIHATGPVFQHRHRSALTIGLGKCGVHKHSCRKLANAFMKLAFLETLFTFNRHGISTGLAIASHYGPAVLAKFFVLAARVATRSCITLSIIRLLVVSLSDPVSSGLRLVFKDWSSHFCHCVFCHCLPSSSQHCTSISVGHAKMRRRHPIPQSSPVIDLQPPRCPPITPRYCQGTLVCFSWFETLEQSSGRYY